MSDTDTRTMRQQSSPDLGDRLKQSGEDAKNTGRDMLTSASEMAREKFDELGATARDTAAQAADKIKSEVGAQQQAGADYAQRLAGNIRNAARAFENDTPFAARTIE